MQHKHFVQLQNGGWHYFEKIAFFVIFNENLSKLVRKANVSVVMNLWWMNITILKNKKKWLPTKLPKRLFFHSFSSKLAYLLLSLYVYYYYLFVYFVIKSRLITQNKVVKWNTHNLKKSKWWLIQFLKKVTFLAFFLKVVVISRSIQLFFQWSKLSYLCISSSF